MEHYTTKGLAEQDLPMPSVGPGSPPWAQLPSDRGGPQSGQFYTLIRKDPFSLNLLKSLERIPEDRRAF